MTTNGNMDSTASPSLACVPGDHRRKWDLKEYEDLAAERLASEDGEKSGGEVDNGDTPPTQRRSLLKPRGFKIDLDSRVGRSVLVRKDGPKATCNRTQGYYCDVCDCVVKDSINFLDHVNGKKHQRNMGMSMKVERSTLEQVRKRFESNKRKLQEAKKAYDFQERVKELEQEEERMKEVRREKRRDKKKQKREGEGKILEGDGSNGGEGEDESSKMYAMMGFSGFVSSKY